MSDRPTLLLSTYELGHQPLGIAWPLACLREAGLAASALDLAVQPFDEALARGAGLVAIAVPMLTALRLGVQAAERVRTLNPEAHVCFYGLYAWLNRDCLLARWADSVIGGEPEAALVDLARAIKGKWPAKGVTGVITQRGDGQRRLALARQRLPVPHRSSLPQIDTYARYLDGGAPELSGYVEATRGCQHLCRHCPIVPVYEGRMVVVPVETVLADIRQQVQAGASHIVFGDPDFLNGPTHSLRITRALHAEFPHVTFDFTAKIGHILEHRRLFSEFAALGCTFVTSAVESLSDTVLARLDKGHTAADVDVAVGVLKAAGIALHPTPVAFTPWTALDDYLALVDFVEARGLQESLAPVQLSIRLLVPPGSLLLASRDAAEWLGELDEANFTYRWKHPDPRMDELQARVSERVLQADQDGEAAVQTHAAIRALAYASAGSDVPMAAPGARPGQPGPRLTENWFC